MEKDMEYYIKVTSEVMLNNLVRREELTEELVNKYLDFSQKDICIIASGSSLNAAITAEWFMNKYLGDCVTVMSPTEYMDYKKERVKDSFMIVISQNGCSTNIIKAVEEIKKDGIDQVCLTGNLEGSIKPDFES